MPIGTVDSRYSAFRYSTGLHEKHQLISCAEDLGDVGTLLLVNLKITFFGVTQTYINLLSLKREEREKDK